MEKRSIIAILFIILSCAAVIILLTAGLAVNREEQNEVYVLRSYGENAALFSGDELIEVYDSIVINTLPEQDVSQLDNGIVFPTLEEAQRAIEDFDG